MSSSTHIGYYAHHQGRGHLTRALSVIEHIPSQVVLFGSFGGIDFDVPKNTTYIELPDDAVAGYALPVDGPYLYTPRADQILLRYQIMLDAIRTYDIRHMHVDVSPEIVSFVKLLGLSCSTVLMQGKRTDPAHSLQYELADAVICPAIPSYIDLNNYTIRKPVEFTGGISRMTARPARTAANGQRLGQANKVQVVCTTSYGGKPKNLKPYIAAAQALPEYSWHIVGNYVRTGQGELPNNLVCHRLLADPYDLLITADYVLGSGGYNSIMEAASLSKKYACQAEPRPFDEQQMAGSALAGLNMAVSITVLPQDRASWMQLFRAMDKLDTKSFATLVDRQAAEKAAQAIYAAAS